MKNKIREVPPVIRQQEALLRRLPAHHEKKGRIETDLSKRWAGFRGEQALDYFLDFLPFRTYRIFQDLRLKVYGKMFQIDTLILTPEMGFLIEVKNLAGRLSVDDESGQFIVENLGVKKRYQNPLAQVNRQMLLFDQWLKAHRIFSFPLYPLVSISNPNAELDLKNTLSVPITHLEETAERIKKVYTGTKSKQGIPLSQIEKALLSEHSPYYSDILSTYEISPTQILKGVQCPRCFRFAMNREKRSWQCPSCQNRDRHAHKMAIADYMLLYGSTLTNRTCQDFIGLPSRNTVSKLLSRMNMEYSGATKALTYIRPASVEKWLTN